MGTKSNGYSYLIVRCFTVVVELMASLKLSINQISLAKMILYAGNLHRYR